MFFSVKAKSTLLTWLNMARSLDDEVDKILQQLNLLAPILEKLDSLCGTVKSIQEDLNTAKVDIGQHDDCLTNLRMRWRG